MDEASIIGAIGKRGEAFDSNFETVRRPVILHAVIIIELPGVLRHSFVIGPFRRDEF